MPFREKSAWISLLSTAVIAALYFAWYVASGRPATGEAIGVLAAAVVALVVVQLGLTATAMRHAPADEKGPRDEREKQIELGATRIAYAGLATSVALACVFGALETPVVFDTNALLFLLVTAEVLRAGVQIVQYRRDR